MSRKALAAVLLAVMLCSCGAAQAEFSPGLTAITRDGETQIEIGAQFTQLAPFSDDSLATVNEWLNRIRIRAAADQRDGRTLTGGILLDGDPMLAVSVSQDREETLTVFSSGSGYVTAPDAPDALSLLAGAGEEVYYFTKLPESYARIAPQMYALLDGVKAPRHSNDDTSIKNASAADATDTYTLTEEEMNALWPQMAEIVLSGMEDVLADAPNAYQALQTLLRGLTFSGQCRFQRYYDKQGGDMGMQFTGNAGYPEDMRKVTLLGGFTPGKGGNFSLSTPAVKGKNNLKITFTGKLTDAAEKKTLTLSGSYSRTMNGQTDTASLETTLTNTLKNGVENWSGKAEINTNLNGQKANWVLKPQLKLDAEGLRGEISMQKKAGSRTEMKGTLNLIVSGGAEAAIRPASVTDLRNLSQDQARLEVQKELAPLTAGFVGLLKELPDGARTLLTHDMRNEDWMNAPAVPVMDNGIPRKERPKDDQWIVSEEEEP